MNVNPPFSRWFGGGRVRLAISDQHAGLAAAIVRCFQGAGYQRCRVYFARNPLANISKGQEMVSAAFRTIFAGKTRRDLRPMGSRRQHAPRALRQGRTLMVRAKEGPLASDLVHQSARASQQRNQTPRQRRRDLSQRRGRHPTLRCRRPRHQRRVGISGTALLLRSFCDRSLPADAMKARRPESSCVPRDRHRG